MQTIHALSSLELELMVKELEKIDKNINKKIEKVIEATNVSSGQALEYLVNNSPKLWAKVYLDWTCRDYQDTILLQGKRAKKLVLRLGRRLGKSECMCILILWHAFTQINKGTNNQYDILLITPYETQIDLLFKRITQLIDLSPVLKSMIKRSVHHKIELTNGTFITGLTAGSKSGSGASNTRGLWITLARY